MGDTEETAPVFVDRNNEMHIACRTEVIKGFKSTKNRHFEFVDFVENGRNWMKFGTLTEEKMLY